MKATANGDTTRVVCKVRARVRLYPARVRASHHAPRHREWPDFGFQLKFCSLSCSPLSLFCFFWAFNWLFFTQKPTKPTENTRIMQESLTGVRLEGAYAHYHPEVCEVVDILFWAVLLEW